MYLMFEFFFKGTLRTEKNILVGNNTSRKRGMTLIDVIVGTALMLIMFLAIFGVLRASILVANLAKSRAGASSLAESQMEYLRGISYDDLGTIGGIPAGVVPQNKTVTNDGVTYNIYTYIQYIDDPADGLGDDDTNSITTDYKLAEVTVSYWSAGSTHKITLISNFAPHGIETTNGGGTLAITVVNATGAPVSGATVHIVNSSTTPAIDLSAFSNVLGKVVLGGAPTSTEYQVKVTEDGYSSAQTYARNTVNQNPSPGYLTVVKDQTTTGTFAIDRLASFTMHTYSPVSDGIFQDSFADESLLSATSSMDVIDGHLELSNNALFGSATSTTISPSNLNVWTTLNADISVSSGSGVRIHLYTPSGVLIPEASLSGNSEGFNNFPVDLSGISTSLYPSLVIGVVATTSSTTIVPKIFTWSIGYKTGPTPLPNASFTLTGTKIIGTEGDGTPIYKTVVSTTTNASGTKSLSLEWDSYALNVPGYDVIDASTSPPYSIAPGSVSNVSLILGAKTNNELLVNVTDTDEKLVSGATVTLSNSNYSSTTISSASGSAYFGDITSATDYTVSIEKSGYTTTVFNNVSVDGQVFYEATFP